MIRHNRKIYQVVIVRSHMIFSNSIVIITFKTHITAKNLDDMCGGKRANFNCPVPCFNLRKKRSHSSSSFSNSSNTSEIARPNR